jgi:hypothetical protein
MFLLELQFLLYSSKSILAAVKQSKKQTRGRIGIQTFYVNCVSSCISPTVLTTIGYAFAEVSWLFFLCRVEHDLVFVHTKFHLVCVHVAGWV